MAIKFNKCDHTEAKSLMICVRNAKLIEEIFNDHESYEKYYMVKSFCKTELNSSEKFEVENILTVGEVVDKFSIKCIEFSCQRIEKSALESTLEMAAETATQKTVDANYSQTIYQN